jgi:hypothetical protein
MPTQPTLTPADTTRLKTQAQRIFHLMSTEPGWYTLGDLALKANASEAGASARLRDFRKPEWGGHQVDRRQLAYDNPLYWYRLRPNGPLLDGKRTTPTAKMQARERIEAWLFFNADRAHGEHDRINTYGEPLLVSDIIEMLK